MKKLLIVGGWLFSTCLALGVSTTTIHFLRQAQSVDAASLLLPDSAHPLQKALAYKHLSAKDKGIFSSITTKDARPVLIAQFLEANDSPLKPYDYWGEYLTQVADKYQMDFRLLPSIAMQESNLCKRIPAGSFNCLGLGVHARGTWEFPSFEANFDKAAEILRKKYINEGLITPDQIQDKYTPGSNGSWEFAVNKFMDKLETADF
jgi:hypothetical protein